MFSMPAPTKFDLNFRLFQIPIQVSPWFWFVTLTMARSLAKEPKLLFAWVVCVFFSILVHELGHGLTGKLFGFRQRIALYWLGGLCQSNGEETPKEKLAVLLMGPGAGFLLAGLVFLVGRVVWGIPFEDDLQLVRRLVGLSSRGIPQPDSMGDLASFAYLQLVYINVIWGLVNLLPIYPLDGGQIAEIFLVQADRVHGERRTQIISLITAGAMAAFFATKTGGGGDPEGLTRVVFFGALAFFSYQRLQAHHDRYIAYGRDDADWWKR